MNNWGIPNLARFSVSLFCALFLISGCTTINVKKISAETKVST